MTWLPWTSAALALALASCAPGVDECWERARPQRCRCLVERGANTAAAPVYMAAAKRCFEQDEEGP